MNTELFTDEEFTAVARQWRAEERFGPAAGATFERVMEAARASNISPRELKELARDFPIGSAVLESVAAVLEAEQREQWAAEELKREAAAEAKEQRRAALRTEHPELLAFEPGQYGSAAHGAKNIRKELKKAFPGVKFSVTSDRFAGGDSIDIRWTQGPTPAAVEEITGKYQTGHFNSSEDMYVISKDNPWSDVFGGAKFVHTQRGKPRDVTDFLIRQYCELQRIEINQTPGDIRDGAEFISDIVYQILNARSFEPGEVIIGLQRSDSSDTRHPFAVVTM